MRVLPGQGNLKSERTIRHNSPEKKRDRQPCWLKGLRPGEVSVIEALHRMNNCCMALVTLLEAYKDADAGVDNRAQHHLKLAVENIAMACALADPKWRERLDPPNFSEG